MVDFTWWKMNENESTVDSYVATVVSIRDREEKRTCTETSKMVFSKISNEKCKYIIVTPRRYVNII